MRARGLTVPQPFHWDIFYLSHLVVQRLFLTGARLPVCPSWMSLCWQPYIYGMVTAHVKDKLLKVEKNFSSVIPMSLTKLWRLTVPELRFSRGYVFRKKKSSLASWRQLLFFEHTRNLLPVFPSCRIMICRQTPPAQNCTQRLQSS